MNQTPDLDSRRVKDRCDWMLNPRVFAHLSSAMGPLQIDLLASHLTRQLPHSFSWRPDPEAITVDTFTHDWSTVRGYANPPWCSKMSDTHQVARSKSLSDPSPMEDSTMVPSPSGDVGGLSKVTTENIQPDTEPNGSEIHHEQGSSLSHMAYLQESFQARGLSDSASQLLLSSWRAKTTSNYNSCSTNGVVGV